MSGQSELRDVLFIKDEIRSEVLKESLIDALSGRDIKEVIKAIEAFLNDVNIEDVKGSDDMIGFLRILYRFEKEFGHDITREAVKTWPNELLSIIFQKGEKEDEKND